MAKLLTGAWSVVKYAQEKMKQLDRAEETLIEHGKRLDRHEERHDTTGQRLDIHRERTDVVFEVLESVHARIAKVEARLDESEKKPEQQRESGKVVRWPKRA